MKRVFTVLAVTALMVAMLMASAIPAFAASVNANCIGQRISEAPPTGRGEDISEDAQHSQGLIGLGASSEARFSDRNHCP